MLTLVDNGAGDDDPTPGVIADPGAPFDLRNFTGFFNPVNNPPVRNAVKAGQTVPVKFSLGGSQGLDILAAGSPSSHQVSCTSGAALDDIELTATSWCDSRTACDVFIRAYLASGIDGFFTDNPEVGREAVVS